MIRCDTIRFTQLTLFTQQSTNHIKSIQLPKPTTTNRLSVAMLQRNILNETQYSGFVLGLRTFSQSTQSTQLYTFSFCFALLSWSKISKLPQQVNWSSKKDDVHPFCMSVTAMRVSRLTISMEITLDYPS